MAGPGGGAVHHWYLFSYEFAFVEVCVLLVIIPIGLVFDLLCHHASHYVSRTTYSYGSDHLKGEESEQHTGDVLPRGQQKPHKQLFLVLLQRMGAEFMTLGFLALCIFVSEAQGLFHALESLDFSCVVGREHRRRLQYTGVNDDTPQDGRDCFHLPDTALDWFHTAEIVHFSLFLGMCFYFMLMAGFVRGSVRQVRVWETMRHRDLHANASHRTLLTDARMPTILGNLPDEDEYRCMQEKFVDAVVSNALCDEEFRESLLRRCGADHRAGGDPHELGQWLQSELRGPSFDFSAYLAYQLEDAVNDNISVNNLSWSVVWLYLLVTAPLHRLAYFSLPKVVLTILVVPSCIWFLGIIMLFRSQQESIARRHILRVRSGALPMGGSEKLPPHWGLRGRRLLRGAQVTCIICSYCLARMVFSQPDWYSTHVDLTVVSTVVLMVVWLGLMLWLQFHAPIFMALMSLPPFFYLENNKAMGNFWRAFANDAPRERQADRREGPRTTTLTHRAPSGADDRQPDCPSRALTYSHMLSAETDAWGVEGGAGKGGSCLESQRGPLTI